MAETFETFESNEHLEPTVEGVFADEEKSLRHIGQGFSEINGLDAHAIDAQLELTALMSLAARFQAGEKTDYTDLPTPGTIEEREAYLFTLGNKLEDQLGNQQ